MHVTETLISEMIETLELELGTNTMNFAAR